MDPSLEVIFSIGVQKVLTRSRLTVAMHQQANGRVENRNKLIETYLRLYITENSQWPTFIPLLNMCLTPNH